VDAYLVGGLSWALLHFIKNEIIPVIKLMTDDNFECKKCGECCRKHPCYLEPEDLLKIAKFLNITEDDLKSSYLVWHNSFKPPDKEKYGIPKLYLFPNRDDYKPIRLSNGYGIAMDDFDESESPCVF